MFLEMIKDTGKISNCMKVTSEKVELKKQKENLNLQEIVSLKI